MRAMDQQQDQEEEQSQMLDTNIKQFIEAARRHFSELMPDSAAETSIPARPLH
jgi:hypothetical protein